MPSCHKTDKPIKKVMKFWMFYQMQLYQAGEITKQCLNIFEHNFMNPEKKSLFAFAYSGVCLNKKWTSSETYGSLRKTSYSQQNTFSEQNVLQAWIIRCCKSIGDCIISVADCGGLGQYVICHTDICPVVKHSITGGVLDFILRIATHRLVSARKT